MMVAVDIGNSRVKWGHIRADTVRFTAALGHDEADWTNRAALDFAGPISWIIGSVQPEIEERFRRWAADRGDTCRTIGRHDVPQKLDLEAPDSVGIDRLLAAFAARLRVPADRQVIVISAGTAITVDWVDDQGTFRGGAILPGPWLMAKALHQYTAKLPMLDVHRIGPIDAPGRCTVEAISAGIAAACQGACLQLIEAYTARAGSIPVVALAGGGFAIERIPDWLASHEVIGPHHLVLEGLGAAARHAGWLESD